MKKLLKSEWGYCLFFVGFITIWLIAASKDTMVTNWDGAYDVYTNYETEKIVFYEVCFYINLVISNIQWAFFENTIFVVFFCILIQHGFRCWIEKDSYGREFLGSLPVKRIERIEFHVLADSIMIIAPILIFSIFHYMKMAEYVRDRNVLIPWLGSAYCGITVTIICYLFMLIGFLYFMESIFVNGCFKILGTVFSLGMFAIILKKFFLLDLESKVRQNLYGFFTMQSVANNYYDISLRENSIFPSTPVNCWVHKEIYPPLFIGGKQLDYGTDWFLEDIAGRRYINQFYDFSHVDAYIFQALCYLAIGVILIVIAGRLLKKQDLSKEGFYFSFGRYLFSALIAGTFWAMVTSENMMIWQSVLVILATVLIFVMLVHFMNTEKKRPVK